MLKIFLLSVSLTAVSFAATPYWIQPCTDPKTGCVAGDVELARWAFEDWSRASNGKLTFALAPDRDSALIRLVWAAPEQGLYGETMPILVNGRRGAQINITIAADPAMKDTLLRDTIVYLTCVHESGHALGLPHTANFEDIMYSFQYGGDIVQYFDRYRRNLKSRDDIHRNTALSPAERAQVIELTSH
jgi:hypothetical protein